MDTMLLLHCLPETYVKYKTCGHFMPISQIIFQTFGETLYIMMVQEIYLSIYIYTYLLSKTSNSTYFNIYMSFGIESNLFYFLYLM